jgi:hypothetical protein
VTVPIWGGPTLASTNFAAARTSRLISHKRGLVSSSLNYRHTCSALHCVTSAGRDVAFRSHSMARSPATDKAILLVASRKHERRSIRIWFIWPSRYSRATKLDLQTLKTKTNRPFKAHTTSFCRRTTEYGGATQICRVPPQLAADPPLKELDPSIFSRYDRYRRQCRWRRHTVPQPDHRGA